MKIGGADSQPDPAPSSPTSTERAVKRVPRGTFEARRIKDLRVDELRAGAREIPLEDWTPPPVVRVPARKIVASIAWRRCAT